MAKTSGHSPPPASAFPSHIAADSSHDSDDDYVYVASLVEQIARAMLDDDDCQDQGSLLREQDDILSCSPFRVDSASSLDVQAITHDALLSTSRASNRNLQGRSSLNSFSSPVSATLYRHHSAPFIQGQVDIRKATHYGKEMSTEASSLTEPGLHAPEREGGNPGSWKCLPHLRRRSQALLVSLGRSSTGAESTAYPSAVDLPPIEHVARAAHTANTLSCCENMTQRRHCHGSLDWQNRGRHFSNARSRGQVGQRRNQLNKDVRDICYYYVQSSRMTSAWQSAPIEITENARVQAFLLGYGSARKETTGTGVFLPRTTGSSHRRICAQVPSSFAVEATKPNGLLHGGYVWQPDVLTDWNY